MSCPIKLISVLLSISVMACAGGARQVFEEEPGVDGGSETGAPPSLAPPLVPGDASTDAVSSGECARELTFGKLTVSDTRCVTNQQVQGKTAQLVFPCAGGNGNIVLGTQSFSGLVHGDTVKLTNVGSFDFMGCPWESRQDVEGDLSSGSLTYSYAERPLMTCPNQFPCTVSGKVLTNAGPIQPR